MIAAIAALLTCQLVGEVVVRGFALPLPGPVAGLLILFGLLVLRGRVRPQLAGSVPEALGGVADTLLRNLALLFIPAAVGLVQYIGLLRTYALPLTVAITVSTTLALVVTALTFRFVSRLHAFRHKGLAADVEAATDPTHHA